ncbi:MAG: SPOR domain-containing protein [Firmicutes bacterium]|nr:SPOR domain-containing protein [Bacillota bacterium]
MARTRGGGAGKTRVRVFWSVWKERISFAFTLVAVGAVAVFLGWLMGQYAIQSVTGPPPAVTPAQRPASAPASPRPAPETESPAAPTQHPAGQAQSPAASRERPAGQSGEAPPLGVWRVQVGAFSERRRAEVLANELRSRGYDVWISPQVPYRVQVGAFSEAARARATARDLQSQGYEVFVVPPG